FIRPSIVRLPLTLVMMIGWAIELFILDVNGTVSNQDLFWTTWQERELGLEVLAGYTTEIVRDSAFVAVVAIVLCAHPTQRFSVRGVFGLLPIMSGILIAGVIIYTKGATQVFPIPFGTFSNAAIVLASTSSSARSILNPMFAAHDVQSSDVLVKRDVEI